jgi:hypothetical protein
VASPHFTLDDLSVVAISQWSLYPNRSMNASCRGVNNWLNCRIRLSCHLSQR